MTTKLSVIAMLTGALMGGTSIAQAAPNLSKAPNVLIILADDQGWGDVGFNGAKEVVTPNLDALANSGVTFSQGYASHPYCSPSRAGLMSGRHQQRFGHEANTPHSDGVTETGAGLPLNEELLSETLSKAGYQTAAIGKWHLGDDKKFWPNNRGFDDWFGFYAGGLNYYGDTGKKPKMAGVLRNGKIVDQSELTYLTEDFTQAAKDYIDKYSKTDKPFFIYLAYNAPHTPMLSRQKYLDRVSHIEDGQRAVHASMNTAMDDGIGEVIAKLKQTGEYDNTIIVYFSDNGGSVQHGASTLLLRGHKGMMFEGGIRVPFTISWPAKVSGKQIVNSPITALDVFPTVLAATGVSAPNKQLDGVNLLPILTGQTKQAPHEGKPLFWRYTNGAGYAVRLGDHKLVYSAYKKEFFLFDIKKDPYEKTNLASVMPEKLTELKRHYQQWNSKNINGLWADDHLENVAKEEAARQKVIEQAVKGDKKS